MSEYHVYVIGLNKEVLNIRNFREANPEYVEGKPCVYVGQSYLTPEERFEQHSSGVRSNRFAKKYGEYLHRMLFEKLNPLSSRDEALQAEKDLALRLRKRGYGVWWG
jgi:hypothetical protein